MKKLLLMPLGFLFIGCNQLSLSQPAVTAGIEGGKITISRTVNADYQITGYESEVAQPTLTFTMAPGSTGITLNRYNVEFQDNSGADFGGDIHEFERSMNFYAKGGWTCPGDNDDVCIPTVRTIKADSINILRDEIVKKIARHYVFLGECPASLRMDITLTGFDDNRKPVSIDIDDADINLICRTIEEEEKANN